MYIDGAKNKGAIPVIITPTTRFDYSNGSFQNDFKDYCTAAKEVAAETNTKIIDLQTAALDYLNKIGYNEALKLYMPNDVLHFNDKGAYQMARLVSEGVSGLDLPISAYVKGGATKTPIVVSTSTPVATPVINSPKPLTIAIYGDLNGDTFVDSIDFALMRRYLLGFISVFPYSNGQVAGDVDGNGNINSMDFAFMRQFLLGIIHKFPAEDNTLVTPTPGNNTSLYQAEDGKLYKAVTETTNSGYTGTSYVNYDNEIGGYIEWNVNVSTAGIYTITLRYAHGGADDRPLELSINSKSTSASLDLFATGSWSTWAEESMIIELNKGNNVIRATSINASGGPNLDYIKIEPSNITTTPSQTSAISTPTATTPPSSNDGPAVDPSLISKLTGTNPIKFHMDVQPGNYDVTVVFGDANSASSTNIEGETRRPMLGTITTSAGTFSRQTFTINVRNPEGQPTGQGGTGTSGLDLVFSGSNPKVNGIGVVKSENPSMIYIAGDSTVCDQPSSPFTGWGQVLPQYFKLGLCIANYGDSGENSGSFLSNKVLFPAIEQQLKKGDYVFIQLGHNDKTTSASAFKTNITSLVTRTKDKGAIPVLISPPVRRLFNSDNKTLSNTAIHINGAGANLPAIMKEVATANSIDYIDLTGESKKLVESLGVNDSKKLFLTNESGDNTHFSSYGANEMAKIVINNMKTLKMPQVSKLR